MDIEEVKEIVKEKLVASEVFDADTADELIRCYSQDIYEDWQNGCNCEEIAQSIIDSEV